MATIVSLDTPSPGDRSHLAHDGAVNIPLHELFERLDEVPASEVWVHCAAGYRASIAASVPPIIAA